MLSFFKKKKIIPHIKLIGVIGNVGKFKQGIDFSGQEDIITKAFSNKNSVYFCGNGGSAADAQHLSAEFSGRFYKDRKIFKILFSQ